VVAAREYQAALGRGRSLTTRKSYPEAIKAFDVALRAWPDDARTLSERGFARLQSGDLDGAERDFYAALGHSPDRAVLSSATYNLALIADRRGQPDRAKELKEAARSNRVPRPPENSCTAEFQSGVSWSMETIKLQTLRQVRTETRKHVEGRGQTLNPPLPTTDEEANLREDMLGGGEGPWSFKAGDSRHLLFGKPLDYTLIFDVDEFVGMRCGNLTVQRLDMSGNPTVVMAGSNSSAGLDCPTDKEPERPCMSFCRGDTSQLSQIVVFERLTGKRLLELSQESTQARDLSQLASFVTREKGVQILGAGCNRFEPFSP
jgi:hypothetical protein